jgi:hypothetical protein
MSELMERMKGRKHSLGALACGFPLAYPMAWTYLMKTMPALFLKNLSLQVVPLSCPGRTFLVVCPASGTKCNEYKSSLRYSFFFWSQLMKERTEYNLPSGYGFDAREAQP